MLWKICHINGYETVAFAVRELKKYLCAIDGDADVTLLRMDCYDPLIERALWVGMDPYFAEKLPALQENGNPKIDDGVLIDVDGNSGIISGINERSVLLSVYRFLSELGCAWIRPGADGEIIPRRALGADRVYICETPSYRHRTMIVEGSVSYAHVEKLIEWIPKIGMSGLFIPFFAPFAFYERWYSHIGNPQFEATPVTIHETKAMVWEHLAELKKRGLLFHAVGHGWTTQPFGIESNDWNEYDREIPDECIKYFAMIDGKRGLYAKRPMLTNCCFSNAEARDIISSYVVEYSKNNRHVDFLHFWFSDSCNTHCECDNCKDTIPSDYYVMLLNEIDEKLTDANLDTKIVFLIYYDLLWAPQRERINNPDRFVMMFAPFSRTYSMAYSESDLSGQMSLAPYERNRNELPGSVEENVARLRRWQEQFKGGDSFIFDYHFFADHMKDPGYAQISKVLFDDMKNLDKLGLNGTVNCQVTRAYFPTGLGICLMAKALWNREADFDIEVNAYYTTAFGERGLEVRRYFETLSALFDPQYLRREKPQVDAEAAKRFAGIGDYIDGFEQSTSDVDEACPGVRRSWEYLRLHAQLCRLIAKALCYKARGMRDEASIMYGDVESWARTNDRNKNTSDALDFWRLTCSWETIIKSDTPTHSQ